MITNFESITEELTPEELSILPKIISSFKKHKKSNPIKAPEVVRSFNEWAKKNNVALKLTEVRLRKFCNYIRKHSLLPLAATAQGYFTAIEKEDIEKQIKSLRERAHSILDCAKGLENFLL
jgi:hypothetical protein